MDVPHDCDKDLLSSVENYKEWELDHVIPKKAGGSDEDDNMALACTTCNMRIKRDWNPLDCAKNNAARDELVQVVRNYITQKRTTILEEVLKYRKIVFEE